MYYSCSVTQPDRLADPRRAQGDYRLGVPPGILRPCWNPGERRIRCDGGPQRCGALTGGQDGIDSQGGREANLTNPATSRRGASCDPGVVAERPLQQCTSQHPSAQHEAPLRMLLLRHLEAPELRAPSLPPWDLHDTTSVRRALKQ